MQLDKYILYNFDVEYLLLMRQILKLNNKNMSFYFQYIFIQFSILMFYGLIDEISIDYSEYIKY